MILTREGKEIVAIYKQDGNEVDEVKDANGRLVYTNTREITGTLPLSFTSRGKPLTDYRISGNTVQDGTPTPEAPVDVVGCGVRTGNLFDKNNVLDKYRVGAAGELVPDDACVLSDFISVNANTVYSQNTYFSYSNAVAEYSDSKEFIVRYISGSGTFTTSANTKYIRLSSDRVHYDARMLNEGSTALPYEPYGYKLPISSSGSNLFDAGTVTNNRYVSDTNGELVYYSGGVLCASDYIDISGAAYVSVSAQNGNEWGAFYDAEKAFISSISGYTNGIAVPDNAKYMRLTVRTSTFNSFMANIGSTALPYEPYIEPTETNIYLGEAQTTRKIKKLVLTGEENWVYRSGKPSSVFFIEFAGAIFINNHGLCTHYINQDSGTFDDIADKHVLIRLAADGTKSYIGLRDSSITSITFEGVSALKKYLAAQYAAGTPVTVWYVLATPETAVVNEPLMKIGDYADTITMAQAGVTIPTIRGTNVLDMSSPVKPSEVYIKGKGIRAIT